MENVSKNIIKREEWIDLLRAFAMFLVVFGHTSNNVIFNQALSPVKMPLFYFLSGFFLGFNKDFVSYLKGVAYRLVLPWFVFSLFPLWVVRYAVLGGLQEALGYIKSFLLGFEVWFIPSFMITQILCYVLYHCLKKNEVLVLISSAACFFLGIILKDVYFFDIWAINTALTGVFFATLGKLFFMHKDLINSKYISKPIIVVAAFLIYILLVGVTISFYSGQIIDFHNVSYYNVPICLMLIFTGYIICLYITSKLKSNVFTKYVAIMGQNTLVIYLASGIVQMILLKILRVLRLKTQGFNLRECFVLAVLQCFVCTVISVICGKICPILIGKKK